MVGQVRLWMALLVLFETAATFFFLMSFFVADVAGSFEAHVFCRLGPYLCTPGKFSSALSLWK